ncbi:GDSL-type esterase/lipase family protein [Nocardioides sp. NPDC000445]|uniref:GDSL-type esterase/lipase family protein n=1 Tax=Nocardioides sp. NPDC000445 TaxID=3154257 RepID=UPI003333B051
MSDILARATRGLIALSLAAGVLVGVHIVSSTPASAAAAYRILVTGDSITQGSNSDYTWRYRLVKKLNQTAPGQFEMVGTRSTLFNNVTNEQGSTNYADSNFTGKAHSALWGTTYEIQVDNIASQVSSTNANVLVTMLGSNDLAYRTSPAATIENVRLFVQRARAANPGIDIVIGEVVTKWDPWSGNLNLTSETQDYASRLATLASSLNTSSERVVTANTRNGWDPTKHTWDGTHPNATGETLIAQRISEGLAKIGIGAASPNIFQTTNWNVQAPQPSVATATEKATLSWSRNSTGATGMFIQTRIDNINQTWQELPYAVGNPDSWTLDPLAAGGTYQFRLRPTKGFMEGAAGSSVQRTIDGITPGAPTGLVTTQVATGDANVVKMKMSWDAGANAQGYMLAQRRYPGNNSFMELPYPITGTSWTFDYLSAGSYYAFRVKSNRGFLSSGWSTGAVKRSKGIPSNPSYAVMGDSYSAGNGINTNTWEYDDPDCFRDYDSWSTHVASYYNPDRRIIACSGSRIADMYPYQANMVEEHFSANPDAAKMITVSVGGNDVGFTDVLMNCVVSACNTSENEAEFSYRVSVAEPRLEAFYSLLSDRFMYTDIIAMGYPSPLGGGTGYDLVCAQFSEAEGDFIAQGTRQLNAAIDRAAAKSNVWTGLGPRIETAFRSHGACDTTPWIHALDKMGGSFIPTGNSFHQNPAGHLQYGMIINGYLIDHTS